MFITTRVKQHPKTFVCLAILVLAVTGVLIVRNALGAWDAGTVVLFEGIDHKETTVAWECSAYNLSYDSGRSKTRSTHRYFVENMGESGRGHAWPRYTYTHEIRKVEGNLLTYNEDESPKVVRHFGNDKAVRPGQVRERERILSISVANLTPGWYKIHAYTLLEISETNGGAAEDDGAAHETLEFYKGGRE